MTKNVVLIGLSGCGKSTAGMALSHKLKMLFVDMDHYIEHKEGAAVRDIFATHGEAYFRDAETEAAKNLSECGGKVIATGGGVVLRPENMAFLKRNGIIVFLDRTPEQILKKINPSVRPLLAQNQDRLFEMDAERRPLYERYADLTVPGGTSVSASAEAIYQAVLPLLKK